jgi:hypothetical protein
MVILLGMSWEVNELCFIRYGVLTVVIVVWDVTPHSLFIRHEHLIGTCCFHLQGRSAKFLLPWKFRQYVLPKRWYFSARRHGITSQKTAFSFKRFYFFFTIWRFVRVTSSFTSFMVCRCLWRRTFSGILLCCLEDTPSRGVMLHGKCRKTVNFISNSNNFIR